MPAQEVTPPSQPLCEQVVTARVMPNVQELRQTRKPPQLGGNKSEFELVEEVGDLFTASPTTSLAHCISKDCKMSQGIAKVFRRQFGRVEEIQGQQVGVGGVAVLRDGDRYIYNLVTKDRFHGKPTMATLRASLEELRREMEEAGVVRVAMPRIGCGLDMLQWEEVSHPHPHPHPTLTLSLGEGAAEDGVQRFSGHLGCLHTAGGQRGEEEEGAQKDNKNKHNL